MRAAGLGACAIAGVPVWIAALQRPGSIAVPRLALCTGGYALFAVCFWLLSGRRSEGCGRLSRRTALALLAVQALTAAALCFLVFNGFNGILLVLIATVALDVLSLGMALVLLALLTLAYGTSIALPAVELWNLVTSVLAFGSFEIFALYVSHVARSERQGREELARVNAELLATRRLLADSSRAAERVLISRELHDALGHHLTALSLHLETARHAPAAEAAAHVETAHALTKGTLQEVRRVVTRLREEPAVDLAGALAELAAGIGAPAVHLAVPDRLRLDDPERAHALLRCAQEMLTNAVRHAGARNLWLELIQAPEGLELRARDDGRGAATVRSGNGLNGMRERLAALGGRLAVESGPGRGFQVTARLPVPARDGALP